ncbi:putative patatin/cPLA2 family phospholipase [Actinoplanes lutulentus]|uniref:Putative patatin/cPLA2 family phospholipase n=1 Tax=Actinoplanes lutulentus TaxID=1287878 RepID=A0A327YY77_9ACTN|nr:patatin-like phospholipase family protein [Actinoplanes lutulentus]MBB2948933.1 putative patatin/cPLA2 family phospholipase [Actinoplanes lutulentus]RAK26284.1 putative patatin/cPLA2 family phospholipase [Actinoplanes lutulentus]
MTDGHDVLRVIADRVATGSRPGQRDDGHRVALAIEGGGMRGTVSAGMALALHEAGVTQSFDAVYGASAGAITGAWLLTSTPEKLTGWADPTYANAMIRLSNIWRGKPMVDVHHLVEHYYAVVDQMDFPAILGNSIEYHPLATDCATGESTDLRPLLTDPADIRLALRASAALPLLAGPPVALGGRLFYDAGLAESVPYRTALAQNATHVLVLRSRPLPAKMSVRTDPSWSARLIARAALRGHTPDLHRSYLARAVRLSEDEATLAEYDRSGAAVLSIRPPATGPMVGRLTKDGKVLLAALEAGRAAAAAVFRPIPA